MRRVIMQLELTLDGFGANMDGGMDWFALDPEAWKLRNEYYQREIGTVLLGRNNYLGFQGYWPNVGNMPGASETDMIFSRWLDATPKVVFSKTLEEATWQHSRLASGDLSEEIARLKAEPGKNLLIMSSIGLAQSFMAAGLIDEYWLTVHPIAIGQGIPLFKERVDLQLLDSRTFPSGQVFLHYERRRA